MPGKTVLIGAATVGLAVAAAGGLTYGLSGTSSTSTLDHYSTQRLSDGTRALAPNIVAGRIQSKYHPLPWIGGYLSHVTCPALPARTGSSITCEAESDGRSISIPVRVERATGSKVTWRFDR